MNIPKAEIWHPLTELADVGISYNLPDLNDILIPRSYQWKEDITILRLPEDIQKIEKPERYIIIKSRGKITQNYLYYYLNTPHAKNMIERFATSYFGNLKPSDLKFIKVPWIPVEAQIAVTNLLLTLDKKADNARREIELLEKMKISTMQRIYLKAKNNDKKQQ